jgi:hypothetical protein
MTSRTLPLAVAPARGARWVYAAAIVVVVLLVVSDLDPGRSYRLWPSLILLVACAVQFRRPTRLGWSVVFLASVLCSSLVLTSQPVDGRLVDYLACAVFGVAPGVFLLLPRHTGRAGG